MTHQPCLSPAGGYRGQFVLDDTRFGSAAVTAADDQTNLHCAETESASWWRRRTAGPIVGTVMMQTTVSPDIGYRQDK